MSAPLSPPPKSLQASLLPRIWAVERDCLLSEFYQLRYIVHIHQSWRRPGCPSARTPLGRGLQRCLTTPPQIPVPQRSPRAALWAVPPSSLLSYWTSHHLWGKSLPRQSGSLGLVFAWTAGAFRLVLTLPRSGLVAQEHVSVTAGLPECSVASDLIPRAPSLPPGPRHHSPHCFFFSFSPFPFWFLPCVLNA